MISYICLPLQLSNIEHLSKVLQTDLASERRRTQDAAARMQDLQV